MFDLRGNRIDGNGVQVEHLFSTLRNSIIKSWEIFCSACASNSLDRNFIRPLMKNSHFLLDPKIVRSDADFHLLV